MKIPGKNIPRTKILWMKISQIKILHQLHQIRLPHCRRYNYAKSKEDDTAFQDFSNLALVLVEHLRASLAQDIQYLIEWAVNLRMCKKRLGRGSEDFYHGLICSSSEIELEYKIWMFHAACCMARWSCMLQIFKMLMVFCFEKRSFVGKSPLLLW